MRELGGGGGDKSIVQFLLGKIHAPGKAPIGFCHGHMLGGAWGLFQSCDTGEGNGECLHS